MKFFKIILPILLSTLISACGGGGGGTPVSDADITTENAQKLSIAATESARQAVNTDTADLFFKSSPNQFDSKAFSEKLTQRIQQANDLGPLCRSGSYTSNLNENTGNGSLTFNNCEIIDFEGNVVVSGTVTVSSTSNSLSVTYSNFTVTTNGVTETVNFSFSCTNIQSENISCSSSSSIVGIDGRNYSISNISVTNNFDSSYDVTAEVIDPDFGRISINAQSVVFDCTAPNIGRPSSGNITFSSNGKSASVVFDSCTSYTVTTDGVANSYTWGIL